MLLNQFQRRHASLLHHPAQPYFRDAAMAESSDKAILAENVQMTFQSQAGQFQILKGINLTIQPGEVRLLMGPSGSGKTTLLQILSGLLTPTAGKVYLLGEEITRLSRRQLARLRLQQIGFIAQDFDLFSALTAAENILFALSLKGIHGRSAQQQTQILLEQVGMQDRANYLPRQLSGGQQQRVSLARALTGNPSLIMADEPTAALDSHSGKAVMTLLRHLVEEKGCTVLMVTHDPRVVEFADCVSHLEDGEIISTEKVRLL